MAHLTIATRYDIRERIVRYGEYPSSPCSGNAGIALDPRVLGTTARELKLRMASLRLDPKTHPIAGDTRLNLLVQGIGASLREPDISMSVRAKQILWFVLMAVGPMRVVSLLTVPSR